MAGAHETLNRYKSTTPEVMKFLELMYTSKNILGVYLIKYFLAKNSIFSNYLAKKCRKPPVFGAVLCISANWRLICLL
jgi:hypothetical protein